MNHRRWNRRAWALPVLVGLVLLGTTACGPGGPNRDELAAGAVFATAMPGASEQGAGGDNARSGIEGSTFAFSWRLLLSQDDEDAVLSWYRSAYEADGWHAVEYPYIAMSDGSFPANAWRRGDLVIGLGFPDRRRLSPEYPDGTLYEVTITYQPSPKP